MSLNQALPVHLQLTILACFWKSAIPVDRTRFAEDSNCNFAPKKSDLEQTCNLIKCETFTLKEGQFGDCSASCGGGYQTAQHICLSSYGYAAPISKCQDVPKSFQECNTQECDSAYYTYSGWTSCSVSCGGGQKTRVATCNSAAGVELTDDSQCITAGAEPFAVTDTCNTRPCEAFNWDVTPWGECDAACGGQRMRAVSCVYVSAYIGASHPKRASTALP